MDLHLVNSDNSESIFDLYSQAATTEDIPKYRMCENSNDPELVKDLLLDELLLDGNVKQNLATFCQTDVDRETHALMDKCIDKHD